MDALNVNKKYRHPVTSVTEKRMAIYDNIDFFKKNYTKHGLVFFQDIVAGREWGLKICYGCLWQGVLQLSALPRVFSRQALPGQNNLGVVAGLS